MLPPKNMDRVVCTAPNAGKLLHRGTRNTDNGATLFKRYYKIDIRTAIPAATYVVELSLPCLFRPAIPRLLLCFGCCAPATS